MRRNRYQGTSEASCSTRCLSFAKTKSSQSSVAVRHGVLLLFAGSFVVTYRSLQSVSILLPASSSSSVDYYSQIHGQQWQPVSSSAVANDSSSGSDTNKIKYHLPIGMQALLEMGNDLPSSLHGLLVVAEVNNGHQNRSENATGKQSSSQDRKLTISRKIVPPSQAATSSHTFNKSNNLMNDGNSIVNSSTQKEQNINHQNVTFDSTNPNYNTQERARDNVTDGNNNKNTTNFPDWIQDYLHWHKEQRATLTRDNYQNHRYIVMTCLHGDRCGGMTDRLCPILTSLRVAHTTSKLLFIYWERPFALEEFLLPPEGGLDWRMPKFLIPELRQTTVTATLDLQFFQNKEPMIVSNMYQSWHYGELHYNRDFKQENEPDAMTVFRHVWNSVFTPSPPVARLIYDTFDQLGLTPGHYASAHIRALYAREKRPTGQTKAMVTNALNCASNLRPGGPFLVTSDSAKAVQMAKEYGSFRNVTVVAPPYNKQPLHLGLHNESDHSVTPADFYNVFSDMYLIAETRCMVVGPGGFGRWGILLGHDLHCIISSSGFKAQTCEWNEELKSSTNETKSDISSGKVLVSSSAASHGDSNQRIPIFRKPMAAL